MALRLKHKLIALGAVILLCAGIGGARLITNGQVSAPTTHHLACTGLNTAPCTQ